MQYSTVWHIMMQCSAVWQLSLPCTLVACSWQWPALQSSTGSTGPTWGSDTHSINGRKQPIICTHILHSTYNTPGKNNYQIKVFFYHIVIEINNTSRKTFFKEIIERDTQSYILAKTTKVTFPQKLDGLAPLITALSTSSNTWSNIKNYCDMWHATCDMWHVTCDTQHVTCETSNVTCDMWHMTYDMWHIKGGEHSLKMSGL